MRNDVVVDAAWVRAHAGQDGFAIIDARDVVFYDGTEPGNDVGKPLGDHWHRCPPQP